MESFVSETEHGHGVVHHDNFSLDGLVVLEDLNTDQRLEVPARVLADFVDAARYWSVVQRNGR